MRACVAITANCVALFLSVCLAPPAPASDKATESLWRALNTDVEVSARPPSYDLDFVQPIARGDEDIRQGVHGRLEVRFNRKPGAAGKPRLESGWEGFQYYVFASAEAATRFALTEPGYLENLKNLLGFDKEQDRFDPRAWRAPFTVQVAGAGRSPQSLRCVAAHDLIGCLALRENAPVVIHLMLQEPALRNAGTDQKRAAIAQERVRTEVQGLLKSAFSHLDQALAASSRKK
jgi:hypothetical protein